MAFTSFNYLIFFIIACFGYFLLHKKLKNFWLLVCSYYFYMSWNTKYALLMLFSTAVTYASGILIGKSDSSQKKKIWVAISIVINIFILFLFKYYTFMIDTINRIFSMVNLIQLPNTLNLLLPVGISFYTFQALSYTIDVYRNDVKIEKNFIRYALFVSFFPQLVAGPIEKSKDLLKQFEEVHKFEWDNVKTGLLLIGIGVFYKLVISDRVAIAVNMVYNNVNDFTNGGGFYFIVATILFAFQIYFDFNAYSTIAKGSAKVLGYELMTNFNKPYFATSIKEFWRRWHISLSSWFKEYLYFPLGGSKKGFWRTQLNLFIVFLVSGLWHGAALTFVIWGCIHGIYQVIGNLIRKYIKEYKITKTKIFRAIQVFVTFILVNFAWIFFRANSLTDAITVISNLFNFGQDISIYYLGLGSRSAKILIITLAITFLLELISNKVDLKKWIQSRNIVIGWCFYYVLIFTIVIFGIYGPGYSSQEFIYFQF